jgi:hypothetical protein
MPMPLPWIEKIFTKLELTYGHRFLSQWPGVSTDAIKADWQHELDGLERRPEAIAYALAHLPPDNPVNVLQFREICRSTPEPEFKALPKPEADKEGVKRVMSEVQVILQNKPLDVLHRQREHMRMEMGGIKLGRAQREFWRVALRNELLIKTGIDTSKPFKIDQLRVALEAAA